MLMLMLFALTIDNTAQNTKFTLVIDAGHGGHDPGAIGAISRERTLILPLSLQLGALVEKISRM